MKRTIENLWNGNIVSVENCGVGDPAIEELIPIIERHKEMLNNELGHLQKQIFEKYVDCTEEYVQLISMCAFSEGFCLAGKLIAEVLSTDS